MWRSFALPPWFLIPDSHSLPAKEVVVRTGEVDGSAYRPERGEKERT